MNKKRSGNKCYYLNCGKSRHNGDVRLFRFPKNEETCKRWIIHCGNPDIIHLHPEELYKKSVCQNHFQETDFRTEKKHYLKIGAVPIHYEFEHIPRSYTKNHHLPDKLDHNVSLSPTIKIKKEKKEPFVEATKSLKNSPEHTTTSRNTKIKIEFGGKLKLTQPKTTKKYHTIPKRNRGKIIRKAALSRAVKTFIRMQFHKKNTSWTKAEKDFSISFYNKSADAYELFQKLGIVLPEVTTIHGWRCS